MSALDVIRPFVFFLSSFSYCVFFFIYVDSVRQGDNYKFVLEDVSHFAESGQTFADKINSKIEKSILEAPEQYLWHHRRFKSQNPEIYDWKL